MVSEAAVGRRIDDYEAVCANCGRFLIRWLAEPGVWWHEDNGAAACPHPESLPRRDRCVVTEPPANVIRTEDGDLRPVCEFCGTVGRPAIPFDGGDRLSIVDVAQGWGVAPYPDDFTHPDGSKGSLWRCPACEARLDRGETLRSHAWHVHDWMTDGGAA